MSGGRSDPADYIDEKARATRELHRIERQLKVQYGTAGVHLIRDILGNGRTVEAATQARGEATKPAVRFWGAFLRRCLQFLAVVLGLATRHAYRRAGARPS